MLPINISSHLPPTTNKFRPMIIRLVNLRRNSYHLGVALPQAVYSTIGLPHNICEKNIRVSILILVYFTLISRMPA